MSDCDVNGQPLPSCPTANEAKNYSDTADILAQRILALIPAHPEIMDMMEPFDLYKVENFDSSDLELSLFQASWALSRAKLLYKAKG